MPLSQHHHALPSRQIQQTPAAKRKVGPPHVDSSSVGDAKDYELLMTFPAKSELLVCVWLCLILVSGCVALRASLFFHMCACLVVWCACMRPMPTPPSQQFTTQPQQKQTDLDSMMDMTLAEAGLDGVTLMMRVLEG